MESFSFRNTNGNVIAIAEQTQDQTLFDEGLIWQVIYTLTGDVSYHADEFNARLIAECLASCIGN